MKVLFVRSGNKGAHPITTNQGESLNRFGHNVFYFDIIGKGANGYLKNIKRLRESVKLINPDLIHAHYSFGGFLSTISLTGKPVVTSLMGSDVIDSGKLLLTISRLFSACFWAFTIVKSEIMQKSFGLKNVKVIPNGVNLERFFSIPKDDALKNLGWESEKKHILFASDPNRSEKNYALANKVVRSLNSDNSDIIIHHLTGIMHNQLKNYYCAADLLLLTSIYEGSPNVVKEAMACNCPIVSTDVGDVRRVICNTEGCYISNFEPEFVADRIKSALQFSKVKGRTNGRERIIELGLDSETIANRILSVYNNVIERRDHK